MRNIMKYVPVKVIIIATALQLLPASVFSAQPDAKNEKAVKNQQRTLQFPKNRSLGQLYAQDENFKKRIDGFTHFDDEMSHQTSLGQAMGEVKIPAGKLVRLSVWSAGKPDLSPLARLAPNSLYQLYITGMTLDDQAMSYVSKLTGLKQLHMNQSKVTSRGFSYISRLKSLEYLTLPLNVTDKDMAVIGELPNLKGFDIYYGTVNEISDDGLKILSKMQLLEEVCLGGGSITDAGLEHLKGLKKLNFLLLWGDRFNGGGLNHLRRSPALRVCNLSTANITDDSLEHLAAMPSLENLRLERDAKISDRGMALLSNSRSLKKLNIRGTQVSRQGVAELSKVKTLEHLELPESSMTDGTLASVGKLPNLKLLHMVLPNYREISKLEQYYGPKSLVELGNLKKLEDLRLSGLAVTDESVEHIAKHVHLKKLWISNSPLSNQGLGKLSSLKSLEELYLYYNHITIGGFSQLGELPRLKTMCAMEVSDDGVPLDLSRLTALERLEICMAKDNAITDKDLACLAKLKNLRHLQLYPSAVSDEGLKNISGLTELYNLVITRQNSLNAGQSITDAGLAHLSKLKNLLFLTLNGDFNGSGLQKLKDLQMLSILEIYSSQDMDPKAVEELRRALPGASKFNVVKKTPGANR
jgi:internalin A